MDYYTLLGVSPNASDKELKVAYRKAAKSTTRTSTKASIRTISRKSTKHSVYSRTPPSDQSMTTARRFAHSAAVIQPRNKGQRRSETSKILSSRQHSRSSIPRSFSINSWPVLCVRRLRNFQRSLCSRSSAKRCHEEI